MRAGAERACVLAPCTDFLTHPPPTCCPAAKIFLFQFVNSYSSLFYVAFLKNSVEGTSEDPLVALTTQLGIIFVSQLVCVAVPWHCFPFN